MSQAMDIKTLDVNLLVTLDGLLSELNVTKAARRLGISQPALSARLNKLRLLFNDPLLLPSQRGMVPTQRATEIREPLRNAVEQILAVASAAERFDPQTTTFTASLAASDYMHATLVVPLVSRLRHAAPYLKLALRQLNGARLWEQVERGDVDIAMMTPESAPLQLRARPLWEERYVFIARSNHPVVQGRVDIETYCALDHVVVSPRGSGFIGPADIALGELGLTRRVALSVNNFLLVPAIVSRSDMVALVPRRMMKELTAGFLVLEPPFSVPGFSISMVWHDRTNATPSQRWLRDELLTTSRSVTAGELPI